MLHRLNLAMILAFGSRPAIQLGLVLALIMALTACQRMEPSQSPSAQKAVLEPRPTVTPITLTRTLAPPTIAVTPTSTETLVAADIGYPPDTRTGIAHLDAIIDAMLGNDPDRVRDLVHFVRVGCTTAEGFGGPPKCRSGEAPGTLVEAVPTLGISEGMALRSDELGAGCLDCRLVAVLRNVVVSIQGEDWWLPARYALVFGSTAGPGDIILLVDEEGIVRFIDVESAYRVWQTVSGEFILPPVGWLRAINPPASTAPELPKPWFSPAIDFATIPNRAKAQRVFPGGTRQVFAFWTYGNMRPGPMVRRDWYRNGELWLTREEPWDFARYGATGVISDVSVYDFEQGLEPGRYALKLSIDGQVQHILELPGNISFEVLKRNGPTSLASPIGSRTAVVDDPRKLIILESDGTRRTLLTANEISSLAWLPDGIHLVYSNRDRSKQMLSAGTIGMRDELWIVDAVSGEHHLIGTAAENLHTPSVSPDGRYIAVLSGTGWYDACVVDQSLAIVELDGTGQRIALHRLDDFAGLPRNEASDSAVYPVTTANRPAPGVWLNSTQLAVGLQFACMRGSPAGIYTLDLTTQTAAKTGDLEKP